MWQLVLGISYSTKIFNGLQQRFQVWQGFINVSESFYYKNSLFILATTGKKSSELILPSDKKTKK
jgi:hypothetical protein